ncbi:uncharacterized protein LOC119720124 isoform X2 [Patiria miniata]|uniref:Uncharacterized protein n=1 Tax=Patiria miniata TaxID=46514 RepID=A0A913Z3L7_PATMI|nr:uncharacterized protein LOC119720124 isoform X2 [Patiria miniata]
MGGSRESYRRSFSNRVCQRPWYIMLTAVSLILAGHGKLTWAVESTNATADLGQHDTVSCVIPDDIYVDYVLELKDRVSLFLDQYMSHGSQPSVTRPVIAAFRRRLLGEGTHPFDRLWVSLCEIEGYTAWLDRASALSSANGWTELSDEAVFLSNLIDAMVALLRSELQRVEACESFPIPTLPTDIRDTTPADQSEASISWSPLRDIDRSQSCATQLKLRVPPSDEQVPPHRLASVLGSMMAAVAQLDFVLKRFFVP